jgi:hypothetical protein
VSAALLLELHRRCDARGVIAWLAATAAGVLSNPAFALMAPVQVRWWLAGDPATRGARLRWLGAVSLVLALLAAPLVPPALRTWDWSRLVPSRAAAGGETPLRGSTTMHPAAVPFALHAFAVGFSFGPSLRELRAEPGAGPVRRHAAEVAAVAGVFGTLGVLGLFALARRRVLLDGVLWLAAPALVVVYFAGQNFKVFNPRYLSVSVPAFLLVLAAGWADRGPRGRWILGAAVAAIWGLSLHHHYFDPAYAREDYRSALASVRERIGAGEQVLAVGAMEPVDYYGRDLPVRHLWLGFAADSARLEHRLGEVLSRANGTWVVLSRSEDLDPAGRFTRRMQALAAGPPGEFPGVRVWYVTRPADGTRVPPPNR